MTIFLLAHGSVDPRHPAGVGRLAERLRVALGEPARTCYLGLCPPLLRDVADVPGVVVPMLFSPGYHVQVDVGQAVADAGAVLQVAAPPLLTSAARWAGELLAETRSQWPGRDLILVTAGTRDASVLEMWDETSEALGVPVVHAGGRGARLSDVALRDAVVVPLLVAHGHFSDMIASQAAALGLSVADVAGTSEALVRELARVVELARCGGGRALPRPEPASTHGRMPAR